MLQECFCEPNVNAFRTIHFLITALIFTLHKSTQFTADLVTFTEEILHGELHFFVQCYSQKKGKKILKNVKAVKKVIS